MFSRFMLSPFDASRFMRPMPGFTRVAAGGGGLTTLTQVASATSTAATITGPAGITAGDLLVLFDAALDTVSTPATVVPTGFTSIVNTSGIPKRDICSYKIANGSEASASITGMDGSFEDRKMLLVFRGNVALSTVTAASIAGQRTSGNPTAQVVTASGGTPPLIVFGSYSTDVTDVNPRTFSPAKDNEINANTHAYFAWKIYNSSPADVTVDMDDESDNCLQSFYLACT